MFGFGSKEFVSCREEHRRSGGSIQAGERGGPHHLWAVGLGSQPLGGGSCKQLDDRAANQRVIV